MHQVQEAGELLCGRFLAGQRLLDLGGGIPEAQQPHTAGRAGERVNLAQQLVSAAVDRLLKALDRSRCLGQEQPRHVGHAIGADVIGKLVQYPPIQ